MGIEFWELEALLRESDLRFRSFMDGTSVLLLFPATTIEIALEEEGEGLLLYAPSVANLARVPYRGAALEWIAARNYHIALGRWGYDFEDGEVTIDYYLPIADGTLTTEQLVRVIMTISGEAHVGVPAMLRAAYSGSAADDEAGYGPYSHMEDVFGDLEDVLEEADCFDPERIPSQPVTEQEWVALTIEALSAGASVWVMKANRCDPRRIREWMEPLRQLRQRSAADADSPWATVDLRDEYGLTDEEELMLLWFGARHASRDRRLLTSEAWRFTSGEPRRLGNPPALDRLIDVGLVGSCDDDGASPYCLSPRALERLGHLLRPPAP